MSTRSLSDRIEELEERLLSSEPLGLSHDIPFGVFVYPPGEEQRVWKEVNLLSIRLSNEGRETEVVDLGAEMWRCFDAHPAGPDGLIQAERQGSELTDVISEARKLLTGPRQDEPGPLERKVIERLQNISGENGVGLLGRAGQLYPLYRTSALLERLIGKIEPRTVLFYPGRREGASELSFMGVCEPSSNYRARIFA